VVFDILRATSTFVTALQNGAAEILPAGEIAEAVALRKKNPQFLLAGERDGVRIRAAQSGGTDFDFGNSPREFTPKKVRGRTIVSTTTNGTRALRACAGAKHVFAGSFLNMPATADYLRTLYASEILLVCAGTGDDIADEDVLAAGAMIELLAVREAVCPKMSDSSCVALETYSRMKLHLPDAIAAAKNGRRLLSIPELRDDVAFCAQQNIFQLVARMDENGRLRRA
jgi:2-phosphosulfolactate phosphatase